MRVGAVGETPRSIAPSSTETLGPGAAEPPSAALEQGAAVGRYLVVKPVGVGAMGEVYSAYDPELHRRVALKVLGALAEDEDAAEAHARWLTEAHALAQLNHPNVVAVHDVGSIGDRVFIAMELVDGISVAQWLKSPRPWREIQEVFVAAGRGLAAAHDAGVVHGDFKPANVMIGSDGRVRVADFGLARVEATPDSGDGDSLAIETTASSSVAPKPFAGTPAYMAPERIEGRLADACSDQFSYCVALYEALYGERPFAGKTPVAVATTITSGEIRRPPPGRRVPGFLRRAALRGLSVRPDQRFASMQALLGALDRSGLRSRRPWTWLGGAGLAVAAAAAAHVVGSNDARCEDDSNAVDRVWNSEASARIVAALEETGSAAALDTAKRLPRRLEVYAAGWKRARGLACHGAGNADERTLTCLDGRLDQLRTLVEVFQRPTDRVVFSAVESVAALGDAQRCLTQETPPSRAPLAARDDVLSRGAALVSLGEAQAAADIAHEVLDSAEAAEPTLLRARALALAGQTASALGEYEEARQQLEEAFFLAAELGDSSLAGKAASINADVLRRLAQYDEAQRWVRLAGIHLKQADVRDGTGELELESRRAQIAFSRGHYETARAILADLLPRFDAALGPNHVRTANVLDASAKVEIALANYNDAERMLWRALKIKEEALGSSHPSVAVTLHHLAGAATSRGDNTAALELYSKVLAIRRAAFGSEHPNVAASLTDLANTHVDLGLLDEAIKEYERALAVRRNVFGDEHPDVAETLTNLATALLAKRDYARAAEAFESALRVFERTLEPTHAHIATTLHNLATLHRERGACDAAMAPYRRALEVWTQGLGPDHVHLAYPLTGIGQCHLERGQPEKALAPLRRALQLRQRSEVPDEVLAETRFALARALVASGRAGPDALALAQKAREGFARGLAGRQDLTRDVDRWLAQHGVD